MEPAIAVILIVFVLAIAIGIRLMAGGMDSGRIDEYIRRQGGQLLDKQWTPFGKGWYGEKDSRIYRVRYRDRQGNIHEASCKTSMFSGVYFTEDQIVQKAALSSDASETTNSLEEENRRLRQELEQLKRRQG